MKQCASYQMRQMLIHEGEEGCTLKKSAVHPDLAIQISKKENRTFSSHLKGAHQEVFGD